ncbi:MAG: DNA recombination protein RmuC [Solirubrobacteraceae bacterium]|nr:DNA recombination protein RmuC [Solirubrobacteraceae bacterium]
MPIFLASIAGFAVGALLVLLVLQRRLADERAARATSAAELEGAMKLAEAERASGERRVAELRDETEARIALVTGSREQLRDELKAISGDALREATEHLAKLADEQRRTDGARGAQELTRRTEEIRRLVQPMQEGLRRVEGEIKQLERDRKESSGQIAAMFQGMAGDVRDLRATTGSLVTALRRPEVRGSWAEIQLRNVVEMAGMVEHCDFVEQQTLDGDEGRLRPDVIVRLPGGRSVVVDSKAPLDAFLAGIEAREEAARATELARHARQVRDHIGRLAAKSYHRSLDESPDFVVMFLPSDAIYQAALQEDPGILELGVEQGVLIATPTTLIALLRAVHYGWRQERIAESAREIAAAARELHKRFATFLEPLAKVGRQLGSATTAYNQAVGSLEARVLPQLRRIEEAGAGSGAQIAAPAALDTPAREIVAPELSPPEPAADDDIVLSVAPREGA